jgi:hypothetical protein
VLRWQKKTERKSRSRQIQSHSLHQINQARPIDQTLYLHEREVTGKETRPLLTGDVAAGAQDGGEAGVGEEGVGPGDAGPEGPEAEQRGEAEEQEPGGGEEARPQERVGAAPGVVAEEGAPASDAGRPGRGAGREERAEEGERHGGDVAGGVHGRGEGRWPGGAVGGGSGGSLQSPNRGETFADDSKDLRAPYLVVGFFLESPYLVVRYATFRQLQGSP